MQPHPAAAHGSLVEALERAAAENAPFVTLHTGRTPEPITGRTALEQAHRCAATLARLGVHRGDRVVLLMPTGSRFVHMLLGSMLLGAIPVPLASPMTFGGLERYLINLQHILKDAGARHMVASRRVCAAVATVPALREQLRAVMRDDEPLDASPGASWLPSIAPEDTAFIQYTSGTTGSPKGVVISHGAAVANTTAIAGGLQLGDRDVGVSWLPMFHDMGLVGAVLTTLCHPYPMHLLSPERFIMNPDSWTQLMDELGATVTVAPNFAYDLAVSRARLPPANLRRLRASLNGAEPVRPATVNRFNAHFEPGSYRGGAMLPVYGMAENTLAVTFSQLGCGMETLGVNRDALAQWGLVQADRGPAGRQVVSVGTPVQGVQLQIADQDDQRLPEDRVGEICVRGASLMDGYFRDPQKTEEVIRDGWLHTGDLGFVHGGNLYVTGRSREMIIKGGRNLYPQDLEDAVAAVPGVIQGGVSAVGRPDPATGTEELLIFAEVRGPASDDEAALSRAIIGELLASTGVKADHVLLRPGGSLPRTTSGKIQRKQCLAWLSGQPSQ